MSDRNPVDTAAPWTIKSISVATREAVTKAARREGLTVGQWLERRVAEWEADGSPVPAANPVRFGESAAPSLDLAGLAQLLGQLGTMPDGLLRRDAVRTTRAVLRQARRAIAEPANSRSELRGSAGLPAQLRGLPGR